jgi:hypothetical protein
MASGALDWKLRFIEVGRGFPNILPGSRVLRWMVPRTVLGAAFASPGLCLAAKPSHLGLDVARSACRLHRPTAYR